MLSSVHFQRPNALVMYVDDVPIEHIKPSAYSVMPGWWGVAVVEELVEM